MRACGPLPSRGIHSVMPFTPDMILADLKSRSKRQVLDELAEAAASLAGVAKDEVLEALSTRERLGTTGVGQGVALPHARLPGLDRLYSVFGRAGEAIPFDAVDDKPFDLFYLLLAPEEANAEHLKALARVARLLRDQDMCARLRGADSAEAIRALLSPRAAA